MTLDMSNLSKELPQSKTSVREASAELTSEFKTAAKSVAALYSAADNKEAVKPQFSDAARSVAMLYRKSYQLNDLYTQSGYLGCLDELLEVIASGGDVENWALTRRAEIIKNTKASPVAPQETPANTAAIDDLPQEFVIPEDFAFTFTSNGPRPPVQFRPQMSPLSIQHSKKQRASAVRKYLSNKNLRKGGPPAQESASSGGSSDEESQATVKRRRQGPPGSDRRRRDDGTA
ncbi:hypothetical protein DIRU0_C00716 [Diutina rugosa]